MAGWFSRLAAGILALGLAGCGLAETASGAGEFTNLDFEAGGPGEGAPSGWFLDAAAAKKGTVELASHGGGQRLVLRPNGENRGGDKPLGVGQLIADAGLAGQRLALSAELAGRDGAAAVVGLVALRGDGSVASQLLLRSGSAELEPKALDDPEPLGPDAATLILFATAEGTAGVAEIDAIAVSLLPTEGGERSAAPPRAGEPSSSLEPAAGGARLSATMTIDADDPLRKVPADLFGTNVEWIRNANGLWNARAGRLDDGLVAAAKAARVTLLRFPGGVFADAYDWRDGIGPPTDRPTTEHVAGGGERSRHVVGTDEMVDLARRIGARLLLTVNVGTGTPVEAADWVAYIRDTHGLDVVACWELGNELYMEGDISGGAKTPTGYAEAAAEYIAAIRGEDPDACVAAIGLLNYGAYNFNSHPDWNEVVLDAVGDSIDLYAIHNAYAPVTIANDMRSGAATYRSMLAAPAAIERNFADTAALVARRTGRGDIGLAVTEWGPFFTFDPANPFFDHVKTLGSGVFAARALNAMLRSSSVVMANFFKLSDPLNMGWVAKDDAGWHPIPALDAFSFYSPLAGATLLNSGFEAPEFRSRGTGFIDPVDDAPTVDGIAARVGPAILAVVNNASFDSTADLEIVLQGAGERFRLEVETLTGPAADAHRGSGLPQVAGVDFAKPEGFSRERAFLAGARSAVTLEAAPAREVGARFAVTLPPLSVARLTLTPVN